MKINSKFVFGVVIVVVGMLLLFEQAGIFPQLSRYVWLGISKLWPVVLIFFGAKFLISRNDIPGIVLLLLGAAALSNSLFQWNFFAVLWPVIIIAVGVSILFRGEAKPQGKSTSNDDYMSDTVAFWGIERKIKSKSFKGGEFNVAFGGLELDLREAKIAKDGAKIHINCAFGGVEVFVPKDCRIKTNGTGFLGGWEPKISERDVSDPVLEITGGVMFGGVDIKE